jgi:hypothetical protein
LDTTAQPTEALQTKKTMPRAVFIVIFEVAAVLGCVMAMFLVPPSTPLKTFLWICVGALICANVLLVFGMRAQSRRRSNDQPAARRNSWMLWPLTIFFWIWIFWKLYERFGR